MRNLQGRVAIITGAAKGIGRGTALALAKRGCRIVAADIDLEHVNAVAHAIDAEGEALAHHCDIAADGAFEALRDAALDRFGRIDIVMNNVGILTQGRPDQLPLEEWRRILEINLFSVIRSNIVFVPLLIEQGEGHIVNTASFAGLYTYSYDRLPYAASKAALVQISEGLSLYLRPFGVGVTCLCPGPVITHITDDVRSFGPAVSRAGPGAQFAPLQPDEVGEMVAKAIEEDRFMVPTHEQVSDLLVERASDWDAFLDRRDADLRGTV